MRRAMRNAWMRVPKTVPSTGSSYLIGQLEIVGKLHMSRPIAPGLPQDLAPSRFMLRYLSLDDTNISRDGIGLPPRLPVAGIAVALPYADHDGRYAKLAGRPGDVSEPPNVERIPARRHAFWFPLNTIAS
jgi:hypothetical protein